jgi:hypothetical protein
MAISRKQKRQILNDLKNQKTKDLGEASKSKRTWSFQPGDLVRVKEDYGIISHGSGGYFVVISPSGTKRYHARYLERVQKSENSD